MEENRLIYIGRTKNETRSYVAESADLVRRWVEHYKIDTKNTIILSDEGRSFLENKKDIFEVLNFKAHYQYFPAVHAYLSPNDNRVHGEAKLPWRYRELDYTDDVKTTVALLFHLDQCSSDHTRKYFERNFLLRVVKPTLLDSLRVIQKRGLKHNKFHMLCFRAYRRSLTQAE